MIKKVFLYLKRVWNRLSSLGIKLDDDIELQKNITITNQLAITWSLIIVPYLFYFFFTFLTGFYILAGLLAFHVIALLLNKFRLQKLSRILESILPAFAIFLTSAYFLGENIYASHSAFHVLNLALASIPLLLFSLREYPWIILSLAISFLYFIFFEKANEMLVAGVNKDILTSKIFLVYNFSVAMALLITGFLYLKNLNQNYHGRIMYYLKLTQEYNERLKTQKDELSAHRDEVNIQNKKLKAQSKVILRQTNEITSSMLYARRIQKAVLPKEVEFKHAFSDHFIYFVPKEIVSGDFYWQHQVNDYHYIAAADCTGHGVPGGFLSMLGVAFLNEICNSLEDIKTPELLLKELRELFIKSLHQTGRVGESRDGMDIALCMINPDKTKLYFSGANNPLYILRDGKIIEYKGDRMPIAYFDDFQKDFTLHVIDLEKDDIIYIFSDGYADQFGGDKDKKLRYSGFKKILKDTVKEKLNDQKFALDDFYRSWSRHHDQIDDMLIIGVRI